MALSMTGIIVGTITVMPALAMVRDMDQRGKALCGSFLVCGASAFAAHMGFAASTQPDLILALLGGKFAGALLGLVIAMRMTRTGSKQPFCKSKLEKHEKPVLYINYIQIPFEVKI